jgi:thymidylate synthase (FAD)
MKIALVSKTEPLWDNIIEFLNSENLPELSKSLVGSTIDSDSSIVELAGRVCYDSYGRGRKDISKYITNILVRKDFSVIEHINYGFMISGVSRSLTHELVRHRHFSFSQRSQRYTDESDINLILPPLIADSNGSWETSIY